MDFTDDKGETENHKLFERAVIEGKATWWQMELPSGSVFFGIAKSEMLGYPEEKFKHYKDFMELVHPDDAKKAMQAMRDHMDGKKKYYETTYKIKSKSGEYLQFYDCGKIIKGEGHNITAIGFVWKVDEEMNSLKQMKEFKEMVMKGNPSMVDLIKNIR